jgi:pimeloyl-ACP methyl ester carboxylesterase
MKHQRTLAAATAALLAVASISLTAIAADTQDIPPSGQMIGQEIAAHQAQLRAQCSAPTVPPDADALPVHVTVWGNKGTPVWLVHGGVQGGLGGGPVNFAGQEPLAARGWQLHVIDRPGFGLSPSRGPDDQEADAKLIADRLDPGSNVIGHSFGGAEALLAAALRPTAVRSLILVEPALQQIAAADLAKEHDPAVQGSTRRVVGSMLAAKTPADFATSFAQGLGSGTNGGPNPSALALQQGPEKATALGCALLVAKTASPDELRAAVQTVVAARIPVLVISGGYDTGQDATASVLAQQLHGQHVIVSSPNHFIMQSNPTGFNDVVDAFMRKADKERQ